MNRKIKLKAIYYLKNGKEVLSKPFTIKEINAYDSERDGVELYVDGRRNEDVFITYDTKFVQFTGLKDNTHWSLLTKKEKQNWVSMGGTNQSWKGKEIYEGDIIQHSIDEEANLGYGLGIELCEVVWVQSEQAIYGEECSVSGWFLKTKIYNNGEDCEYLPVEETINRMVVGNIIENKELLNKKYSEV